MQDNKITEVHVGDIIRATYYKFDGTVDENGLFLVYSLDNYWVKNFSGFSAIKLCTKPEIYQVKLLQKQFPYLDHDSYINCNCTQRLSIDQVNSILGMVDGKVLYCVGKQLDNLNKDIQTQLKNKMFYYNTIIRQFQNNNSYSNSNDNE